MYIPSVMKQRAPNLLPGSALKLNEMLRIMKPRSAIRIYQ
jgi:hypothetical protein